MKRRSTYITHPSQAVDPKNIKVSQDRVRLEAIKGAREERLTVGLKELPREIVDVLEQSHDLHVRWASEKSYNVTEPFVSRISPGLHIHYTPLKDDQSDHLCDVSHKIFGQDLTCIAPSTTFITPPVLSARFARTTTLQYYSELPTVQSLVSYLQRQICSHSDLSCLHSASLLNIADSIDIDYDSISHALTLSVFWSKQPDITYDPIQDSTAVDIWKVDIRSRGTERVELGVLSSEPAQDPSELSLSGFLTVLGQDDHPKATLFSFPSRHHQLLSSTSPDQKYTVSFERPIGLHPILRISFPSASTLVEPTNKSPGSVCALQTYLTLPSHIFIDKWAFLSNDPLFQQSHHLGQLHTVAGDTDLEAPDYVVKPWGSTALFSILTPEANETSSGDQTWDVTIPMHLRYLTPQPGGFSEVHVPWPVVFWACTAEDGTKFPVNPFDRTQLGFEGLFGPRTMFYHLQPSPQDSQAGKLVETISLPVLNTQAISQSSIETLTVATIVLGFVYVLCKLWPGLLAQFRGLGGRTDRDKKSQ